MILRTKSAAHLAEQRNKKCFVQIGNKKQQTNREEKKTLYRGTIRPEKRKTETSSFGSYGESYQTKNILNNNNRVSTVGEC